MGIELNAQEIREIRGILETRLGDLQNEIRHTILSDFKGQLQDRKAFLMSIIDKLERAEDGGDVGGEHRGHHEWT